MGYLGVVPTIAPYFEEYFKIGKFQAMFCASMATASVAITLSHPFDTIKTILQGDIG